MKAEIICVGTELLVGSITNTNSRFLSQKLAENAIDVYHHITVGDNEERLIECLKTAANRADIIITTGGLGPTDDDITSRAVTRFLGRERLFHEKTYRQILKRFKDRRLRVDAIAKDQCYVPAGALVLDNQKGTAPGLFCPFFYEDAPKWLVVLPGPPRELEPMFVTQALPQIFKNTGIAKQSFVVRAVRIGGLLETQVAKKVRDLLKLKPPVTVGIYAKPGNVELKIMSKASTLRAASAAADKIERVIRRRLGNSVFGVDNDTLGSSVGALLKKQRATLSTAESCTGGLVSHMLTQTPGSSAYFNGGVIAYANHIKIKILGVSRETLSSQGAVSSRVATQMAQNIKQHFSTDYGLGITGIAGPDGGTRSKPVGLVYVAVSGPKRMRCIRLNLLGTRAEIKFSAAQKALELLRQELLISSRSRAPRS